MVQAPAIPRHRLWSPPEDLGSLGWNLERTYASLPEEFYQWVLPEFSGEPQLMQFNRPLAESLGLKLERVPAEILAQLFSGNQVFADHHPLAQAYAGHQFGGFTMLGDGRAVLLAEHRDRHGRLWDVQLKGSGRTRFSRHGDGRAALGPMLREYLISEAMAALGIPTTRCLAVVATGQAVIRERALPGAVLTRIASSHLRVGTFEFAARLPQPDRLVALADYAVARHYPELIGGADKYFEFLRTVIRRQARLVALWMSVGFIHGVLNTDNVSIAAETIDYGPCAFMNAFDPATVFSSIDTMGRYAYGNQPQITAWNMARFAETLLPLISTDRQEAIERATGTVYEFMPCYVEARLEIFRQKLGLRVDVADGVAADDQRLIDDLLSWMQQAKADFTTTFRVIAGDVGIGECLYWEDVQFNQWYERWKRRIEQQGMSTVEGVAAVGRANPVVIPRNHRVEEVLAAAEVGDLQPFENFLQALRNPFQRPDGEPADYGPPPAETDRCYRTFCGT